MPDNVVSLKLVSGEKKKKVSILCRLGIHKYLNMVLFFEMQDVMVILNKCLRCGAEYEVDYQEGGVFGQEDDYPTDPYDWDA